MTTRVASGRRRASGPAAEPAGDCCYQVMECEDRALLDEWMAAWDDLVAFEVVPVISSAEAAATFIPPASPRSGG